MLPEPPTSSLQARAPSEDMTMVALHSSPAPVPPVSAPPMGILPEPSREPSPPLSSRTIARPTTSLLPDAPPPSNSLTARELLGLRERRTRPAPPGEGKSIKDSNSGNISEGLMSTSRVHDELTEQLAMVSRSSWPVLPGVPRLTTLIPCQSLPFCRCQPSCVRTRPTSPRRSRPRSRSWRSRRSCSSRT